MNELDAGGVLGKRRFQKVVLRACTQDEDVSKNFLVEKWHHVMSREG